MYDILGFYKAHALISYFWNENVSKSMMSGRINCLIITLWCALHVFRPHMMC